MKRRPRAIGFLLLATSLEVPATAAGNEDALEARVRDAVLAIYVHGVTEEIAAREVGLAGLPVLARYLEDPSFPRRDNVVAFLAFLGGPSETDALIRFLERPPASLEIPEEDRAILLAPQVLGKIASRGDRRALDYLLSATDPGRRSGPLSRADLQAAALRGLAYAQAPEARTRLEQLAETPAGRSALELAGELEGGRLEPAAAPESVVASSWGTLDTQARVHDAGLTYANHPAVASPMTDSRLDEVLDLASLRAGRGDDADDIACCATVSRSGTAKTFGASGDGLDVIDTAAEMSAVLNNPVSRVKVVRTINYCGGAGFNISGCAWGPGNGMALVRLGGVGHEAVLWLHEYGHNTGLGHSPNGSRYIMNSVNYGTNANLTQAECNAYHAPHSTAYMTPRDTGACTDLDGDLVHDGFDNCPETSNHDQMDSDLDGSGDACAAAVCGNGVREGTEECDGSDLGGSSCSTFDYQGGSLACTQCRFDLSNCECKDADADGRADALKSLGSCSPDCDDTDGTVWAAPIEIESLEVSRVEVAARVGWRSQDATAGPATSYELVSGLLSSLRADGFAGSSCLGTGIADSPFDDPRSDPSPNQGYYYLGRARNGCATGSYGDSGESPDPRDPLDASSPCP